MALEKGNGHSHGKAEMARGAEELCHPVDGLLSLGAAVSAYEADG